jgi:hypothetical protein
MLKPDTELPEALLRLRDAHYKRIDECGSDPHKRRLLDGNLTAATWDFISEAESVVYLAVSESVIPPE